MQFGGKLALERGEARRVVDGRIVIVDRTRADDHEQAVVGAVQHAVDRLARLERRRRGPLGGRKLAQQMRRRRELHDVA